MSSTIAARMHTLDINPTPYDLVSGWVLIRSVQTWLLMLRRFEALALEAFEALKTGTLAERDAVAARFALTVANVEAAMPSLAFDADLRAAIDRAVEDARAAGEGSLRMRLEILRQEVQAAEDSLVETLGSVGRAVVAVSVQA